MRQECHRHDVAAENGRCWRPGTPARPNSADTLFRVNPPQPGANREERTERTGTGIIRSEPGRANRDRHNSRANRTERTGTRANRDRRNWSEPGQAQFATNRDMHNSEGEPRRGGANREDSEPGSEPRQAQLANRDRHNSRVGPAQARLRNSALDCTRSGNRSYQNQPARCIARLRTWTSACARRWQPSGRELGRPTTQPTLLTTRPPPHPTPLSQHCPMARAFSIIASTAPTARQ